SYASTSQPLLAEATGPLMPRRTRGSGVSTSGAESSARPSMNIRARSCLNRSRNTRVRHCAASSRSLLNALRARFACARRPGHLHGQLTVAIVSLRVHAVVRFCMWLRIAALTFALCSGATLSGAAASTAETIYYIGEASTTGADGSVDRHTYLIARTSD